MKILMVCLGNICRSPMAEGLLRDKVAREGLDVEVDSAGTANYHIGESPDNRMINIAREKGIDISGLKARQLVKQDFKEFDKIYVMDESNYTNTLRLTTTEEECKKLMMILNLTHPDKNLSVPDPYYGGQQGFKDVFNILDLACEEIINKIKNSELR